MGTAAHHAVEHKLRNENTQLPFALFSRFWSRSGGSVRYGYLDKVMEVTRQDRSAEFFYNASGMMSGKAGRGSGTVDQLRQRSPSESV